MSLRRLSVSAGYMLLVTSLAHSESMLLGYLSLSMSVSVCGVRLTSSGRNIYFRGLGQGVTSCRRCANLALFRLLGSQGVNARFSIFYCALQSSNVPFNRIIVVYIAREYNVD